MEWLSLEASEKMLGVVKFSSKNCGFPKMFSQISQVLQSRFHLVYVCLAVSMCVLQSQKLHCLLWCTFFPNVTFELNFL